MPRDVSTRWNSTFDMLQFAVKYREALDRMTSDKKNDLRAYEMDRQDWAIAAQLSNVLEVSCDSHNYLISYLTTLASSSNARTAIPSHLKP